MGFLMLTRRPGEEIDFTLTEALPKGTRIKLSLMGVKGNQARFGIEAPRSVTIDRAEITKRKQDEAEGNKDEHGG